MPTQEQIQAFINKGSVSSSIKKSAEERMAELRRKAQKTRELEQYRQTDEHKTFLETFADDTGIPSLIASGVRATQGTFGLGKATLQYMRGEKEQARRTIMETGAKTSQALDLGILGEYEAPDELREVIGTGLKAGTTLGFLGAGSVVGTTGRAVATRIGMGGVAGGLTGAGESIEEGGDVKSVAKSTMWGVGTGLAVAGAFEGLGFLLRKMHFMRNIGKNTYNKELQPPRKELTNQIEHGWRTFGEEVRNLTDDAGRPIYKGTYKTMKKQALSELSDAGNQLKKLAQQYDDAGAYATSNEIAGDIVKEMQDTFGDQITNANLRTIKHEVSRLGRGNLNISEMIDKKRMYDGLIPDSYWVKAGDANTALVSQVKYSLRDRLRQMINQKTKDEAIKHLNHRLSIAMDVKHLTSEQIAVRATQKISGGGGYFYKLVGRFIDDYIFNPAITTRASQATKRIGEKVGQTIPRRVGRLGIIEGISSKDQK